MNLETGGLLLADAACGKKEFDESFRELVKKMYPDAKLEVIPLDDELYSEKLNGVAIRTVKRREKLEGEGPEGGFKELPSHLEGVKIDGRWAIISTPCSIIQWHSRTRRSARFPRKSSPRCVTVM